MAQPGLTLPLPRDARRIQVPAVAFDRWLAEIDNPEELRVTLRALGLLAGEVGRRGAPPSLAMDDLLDDTVLQQATDVSNETAIRRALAAALHRGTLAIARVGGEVRVFLNDERVHEYLETTGLMVLESVELSNDTIAGGKSTENVQSIPAEVQPDSIIAITRLYEQNFGSKTLNERIADELRGFAEDYPMSWIAAAFKEAAEGNNWNIARVTLRKWEEIRKHGEPRNDTTPDSRTGYLEYYRRRYGRLPWELSIDTSG